MITIAQTVDGIVSKNPLYRDALACGIVNYSALARLLQLEVEEIHMEKVTEGALIMALKRCSSRFEKMKPQERISFDVKSMVLRSNLAEFVFTNSESLLDVHAHLLATVKTFDDAFLNFIRGAFQTNIILSDDLVPKLEQMAVREQLIVRCDNLSAVTLRFPYESMETPGMYYPYFKALAWEGINFIEVISVYCELTFVFEDKVVDRAFSVIKNLARNI